MAEGESEKGADRKMEKNVLVIHGGGPTAVLNASLYGVIQSAKESGEISHVYGAIGGSEAILKERFLDLMQFPEETLKRLLTTPFFAVCTQRGRLCEDAGNFCKVENQICSADRWKRDDGYLRKDPAGV